MATADLIICREESGPDPKFSGASDDNADCTVMHSKTLVKIIPRQPPDASKAGNWARVSCIWAFSAACRSESDRGGRSMRREHASHLRIDCHRLCNFKVQVHIDKFRCRSLTPRCHASTPTPSINTCKDTKEMVVQIVQQPNQDPGLPSPNPLCPPISSPPRPTSDARHP